MLNKLNHLPVDLTGLNYNITSDSVPWFLISLLKKYQKISYICSDNKELYYLSENLRILLPEITIFQLPSFDCPLFSNISPTVENKSIRISALTSVLSSNNKFSILLTTFDSLLLKTTPKTVLKDRFIEINIQKDYSIDGIKKFIMNNGYCRVDTVRQKCEYAIRGGIIDIFSPSEKHPIRLDTFGSDIESMKVFDPITQLSLKDVKISKIISSSEILLNEESIKKFRVKFRELEIKDKAEEYNLISEGIKINGIEQFLPMFYDSLDDTYSYFNDFKFVCLITFKEKIRQSENNIVSKYKEFENMISINDYITRSDNLIKDIQKNDPILITNLFTQKFNCLTKPLLDLKNIKNQRDVSKLITYLEKFADSYEIIFAVRNSISKDRIENFFLFESIGNEIQLDKKLINKVKKKINFLEIAIKKSFVFDGSSQFGLVVITDEDLFGNKVFRSTQAKIEQENFIYEVSTLNEGDLIVHHEHGIGKYIGLKNIPLYLNIHECVEIEYYNKDKLFIPVENLDLISRYGDKDNPVSLDKLGSSNWQLRKSVIKDKIKIIAHDLIQIAAERALKKGRIMVPDFDLYENFSSKFEYAETSDQIKAINDVEDDLSSGKPMDRLICGDVGFGKTEISMRAAFIAAMNDYQVIFLCPTTLLANQHYKSFISRFENFNINIKKITRFESRSEKTSIYENIENNSIKIIIGTHALFNHSINFNNLGLLIVDEEQSFGVEQKEKLKKIKSDIHVLTLTATPIPRTLQSSLLGIRDLSIIKTPPIDRLPIKTFLTIFNKTTIRNAILNEIERGGQVFYVSPKIKDLNRIKEKLSKILPKVSCEIVHGRLSGEQLNDIYSSFFENKIKILISTSIIESGLDVSNANTIIIEKPNYFGLSQIYQLRGRVGRSDIQSYAYLVLSDNQILSTEANKRLNVIANLDTLGGGFSLASHDMNIRGTGNLIGSEQSGHVREVGIELYQKLVKDAINETKSQSSVSNDWSPQINIGFSVYIPKEYIPDLQMRLNIYRRISFINSVSKIKEILLELKDRFGNVPEELINLTKLIEIKNLCRISNINKVDMGSKGFTISFRNNRFNNIQKLLNLVSKNSNLLKIRPDNKLLYLKKWTNIDDKINDIIKFLTILSKMQNEKKISNNHQD